MLRIAAIMQNRNGVAYHRIEIPLGNLNQRYGDKFKFVICDGFTEDFPPDFDIIIVNKVSSQARDYISEAKENGAKIILDLDDWIEFPEWHSNHNGFYTPEIEARTKHYLKIADVVWCASEHLMYELVNHDYCPVEKMLYVPNAIDFSQPQFMPNKWDKGRYTVGWIGASNHQHDVSMLGKPLEKLLGQKNYDMLCAGISQADPDTERYWSFIQSVFTSNFKLDSSRFKRIEAMDSYNYAFSYNLCDLVLAPLKDDIFTRCKSNLKVLEAGAFSLPIICSNVEPYKEFIRQGLVYCSEGNWDSRIRSLIRNPQRGRLMGARLHEYVKENYNIEKINDIRYDSITGLMD